MSDVVSLHAESLIPDNVNSDVLRRLTGILQTPDPNHSCVKNVVGLLPGKMLSLDMKSSTSVIWAPSRAHQLSQSQRSLH